MRFPDLIHLSFMHSILIPLYLPLRIIIPYIYNYAVGVPETLTQAMCLCDMSLRIIHRLIIPRKMLSFLCEYLISSRSAVCTFSIAPPCSTYRCKVVFCDISFNRIVMIFMLMTGKENHLTSTQDIQKRTSVMKFLLT